MILGQRIEKKMDINSMSAYDSGVEYNATEVDHNYEVQKNNRILEGRDGRLGLQRVFNSNLRNDTKNYNKSSSILSNNSYNEKHKSVGVNDIDAIDDILERIWPSQTQSDVENLIGFENSTDYQKNNKNVFGNTHGGNSRYTNSSCSPNFDIFCKACMDDEIGVRNTEQYSGSGSRNAYKNGNREACMFSLADDNFLIQDLKKFNSLTSMKCYVNHLNHAKIKKVRSSFEIKPYQLSPSESLSGFENTNHRPLSQSNYQKLYKNVYHNKPNFVKNEFSLPGYNYDNNHSQEYNPVRETKFGRLDNYSQANIGLNLGFSSMDLEELEMGSPQWRIPSDYSSETSMINKKFDANEHNYNNTKPFISPNRGTNMLGSKNLNHLGIIKPSDDTLSPTFQQRKQMGATRNGKKLEIFIEKNDNSPRIYSNMEFIDKNSRINMISGLAAKAVARKAILQK
ncbi:hypothetical protein BB559_004013 [Furculomyces boomerangus]|uniref:Uncharacterized protein n=2 Tax=Harpellales TaxID=61421 RepID=A0A2T9YH76_9FUNG|nr:hypothetical protein BB559_004013 [Furculomyces boomerangus]PVZ98044.1 hypothetical protein BB558_005969 [Smittium angustum]PVZ98196.1 hypothetical protein BB558_005825 [Smittium angustum]